MIRHVVFFKFREDVAVADRDAALDALGRLDEVIDVIRTFEVGGPQGPAERDEHRCGMQASLSPAGIDPALDTAKRGLCQLGSRA